MIESGRGIFQYNIVVQINVQYSLIRELIFNEFEFGDKGCESNDKKSLCEKWRRSWSQHSKQFNEEISLG